MNNLYIAVYSCGKTSEYIKTENTSFHINQCVCKEKTCKPLKDRYSRTIEICNPVFVGEKIEYIKKIRKDKLNKLDGIKNIT